MTFTHLFIHVEFTPPLVGMILTDHLQLHKLTRHQQSVNLLLHVKVNFESHINSGNNVLENSTLGFGERAEA